MDCETFRRLYRGKAWLSPVKPVESSDFLMIILKKLIPFSGIIRRSSDFLGLSCWKACLSTVWSAKSQNIPRTVLRTDMPFHRIFCRKSELSMDYPAESFTVPLKVKISLFIGLSLLLKLISDNNFTHGWSVLPKVCTKFFFKNIGSTKKNFLTFRRLTPESQTSCTNISANFRKNMKVFLDVHQWPTYDVLIHEINSDHKISCYSPLN
jgi:hypothetical protein